MLRRGGKRQRKRGRKIKKICASPLSLSLVLCVYPPFNFSFNIHHTPVCLLSSYGGFFPHLWCVASECSLFGLIFNPPLLPFVSPVFLTKACIVISLPSPSRKLQLCHASINPFTRWSARLLVLMPMSHTNKGWSTSKS